MARTLSDILFRRTGLGTLGHPGDTALKSILELSQKELNWPPARVDQELETANKSLLLPA